jgi:hypothetical protein
MLIEIVALAIALCAVVWGSKVGGGIMLAGVFGYFINKGMMIYLINRHVPEILDEDIARGLPGKDGDYRWEKTAGTGIVPRWLSLIGLLSLAAIATGLFWTIIALVV